jgi:hypothetical protein
MKHVGWKSVKKRRGKGRRYFVDKEWLEDAYTKNHLSLSDISKILGLTKTGVQYWLMKYNIPRKTPLDGWLKEGHKHCIRSKDDPRIKKAQIGLIRRYLNRFKKPKPVFDDVDELAELDLVEWEKKTAEEELFQGQRKTRYVKSKWDKDYEEELRLQPENNLTYQKHLQRFRKYRRMQKESGLSPHTFAKKHRKEHTLYRRSLVCVNRYWRRFGWRSPESSDYSRQSNPISKLGIIQQLEGMIENNKEANPAAYTAELSQEGVVVSEQNTGGN